MRIRKSIYLFFSIALLVLYDNATAGEYVRISPDLEVYYEEAGIGNTLIFIPGWCGTTEFFMKYQIPHFSKNYRVISYDPRSHGRSSKTLENNNYIQHGKDLRAFMEALELKNVILAGHSAGCYDIYAYVRAFGTDNVKACIFIDQPPKTGQWSGAVDQGQADQWFISDTRDFINGTVYNRRGFMTTFIPTMFKREIPQDEFDWLVDQLLKTPTYVAALLAADIRCADYTVEAQMIDGKIPVLNVLSEWFENWAESGQVWLTKNAPNSEILVLGKHMMFMEFRNEFNAAVDAFLTKIK